MHPGLFGFREQGALPQLIVREIVSVWFHQISGTLRLPRRVEVKSNANVTILALRDVGVLLPTTLLGKKIILFSSLRARQ